MYPTIQPGNIVFASLLGKIDRGSVVTYKPDPLRDEKKEIYCGRIVAVENDVLEIKKGLLFINGQMVDDTAKLAYLFWLTCGDADSRVPVEMHEQHMWSVVPDSVYAGNFSYSDLAKFKLDKCAERRIDTLAMSYDHMARWPGGEKWSISNFGPVTIPAGHYFIMGDNRDNSLDSRFRGFIPKDKVLSKVLNVD